MTIDKFYNETFDFTLEIVVFDSAKVKECNKVDSLLIKMGLDKSVVYDNLTSCKGFCTNFYSCIQIVINIKRFRELKYPSIEAIKTLQHECGHVRGFVLDDIAERITTTDSEVYTRISDWAFKKCMTVKYFKKLLK